MQTLLNNRYRVLEELGRGGFGQTFLAEDTHLPSRRRCVIKKLLPLATDPNLIPIIQQRFEREAAILEELGDAHDQIPRLYAYFVEVARAKKTLSYNYPGRRLNLTNSFRER